MSVSTLTGSFGSIYVPASLVNSYKTATNWAKYADRITVIEGDTGGGGNGNEGGEDTGNETTLINFTVDGVPYQAENGMTWEEWCNSEYNTDSYSIMLYGEVYSSDGGQVCYSAGLGIGDPVNSEDEITSEYNYRLY